jgi:integrase
MAEKGQGTRQGLLVDKDVKRWYDNLARGAKSTADNYLRILGRFLEVGKIGPHEFVKLKPKERDDLVSDHITQLLAEKKAGSTAAVVKKAIISWLDWNGEKLHRKIKIPGVGLRPSLKDAHIPTQDELRRALNIADARGRSIFALIAYAGLRPEVMGDYTGENGLRLRDFPEAKVGKTGLMFEKIPARISVPEELSKTGKPYFTFLGPEGCDYLQAYVGERMERGEKVTLESPVIRSRNEEKPFLRSLKISDTIRKPMRAAGLKEPPYIWRSYFSSRAMLAEGRGLLRDYRQFFMGHSGDIEHVYALHKRLPADTIEQMRKAYAAALPDLETRMEPRHDEGTARMVAALLRGHGASEEDVVEMKLETKTEDELAKLVEDYIRETRRGQPGGRAAAMIQEIVPYDELKSRLAEGWVYRATLPGNDVLIERRGVASPGHDGTVGLGA